MINSSEAACVLIDRCDFQNIKKVNLDFPVLFFFNKNTTNPRSFNITRCKFENISSVSYHGCVFEGYGIEEDQILFSGNTFEDISNSPPIITNQIDYGAAISLEFLITSLNLYFKNNSFVSAVSNGSGGAFNIISRGANVLIEDCIFQNCKAKYGGAIYSNGTIWLEGCSFYENQATTNNGGNDIYFSTAVPEFNENNVVATCSNSSLPRIQNFSNNNLDGYFISCVSHNFYISLDGEDKNSCSSSSQCFSFSSPLSNVIDGGICHVTVVGSHNPYSTEVNNKLLTVVGNDASIVLSSSISSQPFFLITTGNLIIENITLEHSSSAAGEFISLKDSGTVVIKYVIIMGTTSSTVGYSFIVGGVSFQKPGTIELGDLEINGLNFTEDSSCAVLELKGLIHLIIENIEVKNVESTSKGYLISSNDDETSLKIMMSYSVFSYLNFASGTLIYVLCTSEV
jgi:hypothetical protein